MSELTPEEQITHPSSVGHPLPGVEVRIEDEQGNRVYSRLGKWECVACPPGVIHGYVNDSLEPVYFQVMLGRAKPETMGYADDSLFNKRDAHLKT